MGKYSKIKKEFSFLESEYGFKENMRQKHGSYYYSSWTNLKKDIMILYDDTTDEKVESPIWIRMFDTDSLGLYDDVVDEFRNEFYLKSGKSKERIHYAAEWLKKAIEDKKVLIE